MEFWFGENPARWIARHGRPAAGVGVRYMPSYESEDQTLLVFKNLIAQRNGAGMMFFPSDYDQVALDSPSGPVRPHSGQEALIPWRPCVYEMVINGIEGKGSQQELEYRYVMARTLQACEHLLCQPRLDDHDMLTILRRLIDYRMTEADQRAEELLLEVLSPQQRLEYRARRRFRVRGGRTGNLYGVHLSHGFTLLDCGTNEVLRHYCLHPEYWLPAADVALALKLALEDRTLERDCLKRAGGGGREGAVRKLTKADQTAYELELELIK